VTAASAQSIALDAARAAAAARTPLALLTGADRANMLVEIARSIRASAQAIIHANAADLAAADRLSSAMRDRLRLDEPRIAAMADAVASIAAQPDPVGEVISGRVLPNGVRLEKRRVPLGVVLVIYESRPNVTSDAAALCLKAGNAVVLKGGSEAMASNRAIVQAVRAPLDRRGIGGAVQFVDSADRQTVEHLVRLRGLIDLAIPRGGPGLIKAVTEAATIPVVKHDAGNCHIYIDEHLDGLDDAAQAIVVNAKTQRPGVCNAVETLLVHRHHAPRLLPRICAALAAAGVEIRGCNRTRSVWPNAKQATDDDWRTEFLDLILAVRIVDSLDDAVAHIRDYGSQHTEAIITSSIRCADRFVQMVDSASVMVNCSTRLADGGQYGLGAEIGISTDKLHARGPMGAADLTTFQWVARGDGQVRG